MCATVHFAATITVTGVVFFSVFIAEPAFRQAANGTNVAALVSPILVRIGWIGLVVTVVSGSAWLALVAQSMSDSPLPEVFSEGILWTVLLQTGFGRDWLTRFVLVCLLGATFVPFFSARASGLFGSRSWQLRLLQLLSARWLGRATLSAAQGWRPLSIRLLISYIW